MQKIYIYFILLCCSLVLFLPGLEKIPMLDRDSAHFSQASKQMLESGDFFQIKFQNEPRHLKPPGIYWFQAACVHFFSNKTTNETWPYRVPSLLGAMMAIFLLFYWFSLLFNDKIALNGSLILACSLLLNIEVRQTITDTCLLASSILMLGALASAYCNFYKNNHINNKERIFFWLGMASGIFFKGLTPLYAALILIPLSIIDRKLDFVRQLKFTQGIIFNLLIILAWSLPISFSSNRFFIWDMIHQDLLPKIFHGQESHGMPPGYYAVTFTLFFWPFSLFFWRTLTFVIKNIKDPAIKFLVTWSTSIWLFYELIATKLPEYVLPSYPALAILIGVFVYHCAQQNKAIVNDSRTNPTSLFQTSDKQKYKSTLTQSIVKFFPSFIFLVKTYDIIWLITSIGFVLILPILEIKLQHAFSQLTIIVVLILIAIQISSVIFLWKQKFIAAFYLLLLHSFIAMFYIFQIFIPDLHVFWTPKQIASYIEQHQTTINLEKSPLFSIDYCEPSLIFYVGTNRVVCFDNIPPTQQLLSTQWLLSSEKQTKTLLKNYPKDKIITSFSGFNYNHGSFIHLNLVEHHGQN